MTLTKLCRSILPAACFFVFLIGLPRSSSADGVLIASNGFESADNWAIASLTTATVATGTTVAVVTNIPGASDTPANSRIRTGSFSLQMENTGGAATSTLDLVSFGMAGFTARQVVVHCASISATTGNGIEAADFIHVFVALNGAAFSATPDIKVNGGSSANARWDFGATNFVRTTAGVAASNAAPQGGTSSNNFATLMVDLPDSATSVAVRVRIRNDAAAEIWCVDDIQLKRDVTPAAANLPPVLTVPSARSVTVSNALLVAVSASEIDNDAVTLTASNVPVNATFFPTNGTGSAQGTLLFTPDQSQTGQTYVVTFYAGDKDGTNSATVSISVFGRETCGVIISEYVEGTGNNKAIEIFNGTGGAINLGTNGGNYVLQQYLNGSETPSSVALTGTIQSAGTYVIAHGSSTQDVLDVANQIFGFTFNGDDAIVLRSGGTNGPVVDSIGVVGEAVNWGGVMSDRTLRRKPGVTGGERGLHDVFIPTNEWDVFNTNTFDGLGSHVNGCGSPPSNEPPVLAAIGNKSIQVSNALNFAVTASDPVDGDVITLSASNLPPGAVFNIVSNAAVVSNNFTWASAAPAGVYTTTFYAVDKDGFDFEEITITVTNPPPPPPVIPGSTIIYQRFEPGDPWTIDAGAAFISTNSGPTNTPANQQIFDGTHSWQSSNATNTLDLASVSLAGYTNRLIRARLSSISVGGANGADGTDFVRFYSALNGAAFTTNIDIQIIGNANARWGFDAVLFATSTSGVTAAYAAPQGGGSSNNYATVVLFIPESATSVAFRVVARNDSASEIWALDDITLFGDPVGGGGGDTDGDGIPDEWETLHFGGPTNAAPGVDSDGDKFSNLEEYIAGTNPTNGLSFFEVDNLFKTGAVGRVIQVLSVTGRLYSVDYTTNLLIGGWTSLVTDTNGAGAVINVLDTNDSPTRSYRSRVRLP